MKIFSLLFVWREFLRVFFQLDFAIIYRTETVYQSSYKSTMKLTIANVQKTDYGTYKCVAKNPRGETDGTIRLYCKFWIVTFMFFHITFITIFCLNLKLPVRQQHYHRQQQHLSTCPNDHRSISSQNKILIRQHSVNRTTIPFNTVTKV